MKSKYKIGSIDDAVYVWGITATSFCLSIVLYFFVDAYAIVVESVAGFALMLFLNLLDIRGDIHIAAINEKIDRFENMWAPMQSSPHSFPNTNISP
jgi:hypothetical protein